MIKESSPSLVPVDTIPTTLVDELTSVRSVAVTTSTHIGYTLLNQRFLDDAPAIVSIGGFMSDLTTPDRAYEGLQLASTGRPVLMLDLPGHGKSSPHNARQIVDLCFRRSSESQAEPLIEATHKLLGSSQLFDIFGISHGAYMGLKVAEHYPVYDAIQHVFGVDVPAVRRRSTIGLQVGYALLDGVFGKRRYAEALENTPEYEDFEAFKSIHSSFGVKPAERFHAQNPALFYLNLFSSINASDGAIEAWRQIAEQKAVRVRMVTAANSHVSDPESINEFINSLPPEKQARHTQVVIEGEDHNIGMVYLIPRAVRWAKTFYRQD